MNKKKRSGVGARAQSPATGRAVLPWQTCPWHTSPPFQTSRSAQSGARARRLQGL